MDPVGLGKGLPHLLNLGISGPWVDLVFLRKILDVLRAHNSTSTILRYAYRYGELLFSADILQSVSRGLLQRILILRRHLVKLLLHGSLAHDGDCQGALDILSIGVVEFDHFLGPLVRCVGLCDTRADH